MTVQAEEQTAATTTLNVCFWLPITASQASSSSCASPTAAAAQREGPKARHLPSSVFGPVRAPPCILQRRDRGSFARLNTGARHT